MTAVTPFLFQGEHLVRVIEVEGEPWFVGKDVCRALGIVNHNDALGRLDPDERKGVVIADPPVTMVCVSEPGLYRLIFTSRVPAAERFKRWLAHDVLPTIRKTGRYVSDQAMDHQDLPAEDVRYWLKMVGEARMLFGKTAARDLWRRSPLPAIAEASAPDQDDNDGDPQGCLRHLLDWQPTGGKTTADLLTDADPSALRRHGLAIDLKDWSGWLAIAASHPDLVRLYRSTRWAGAHNAALLRLPQARRHPGVVKFKNCVSRAVLVPLNTLGF